MASASRISSTLRMGFFWFQKPSLAFACMLPFRCPGLFDMIEYCLNDPFQSFDRISMRISSLCRSLSFDCTHTKVFTLLFLDQVMQIMQNNHGSFLDHLGGIGLPSLACLRFIWYSQTPPLMSGQTSDCTMCIIS